MSDLWATVANAEDSEDEEYQPETAGESHLLLLWKKKYCDVIFTFPNLPDRIAAHEVYLKARSPVFAKIFRMRKSGNVQGKEIEISESTPKIFQLFLEFIYADRLDVDIAGALALLQLSHKYKVQPLLKKCEEILQTEISPMDSVKVFEAARRCGMQELMDRAGPVMVKSFYELLKTGVLSNAEEETIACLLENDNLAVEEKSIQQVTEDSVSVQPPVELLSGRTYSVIFEDFSTGSVDSFRKDPQAYWGFGIPYMKRLNVYLEDLRMSLEEITRTTDFYAKKLPDKADEIAVILGIRIGLL